MADHFILQYITANPLYLMEYSFFICSKFTIASDEIVPILLYKT